MNGIPLNTVTDNLDMYTKYRDNVYYYYYYLLQQMNDIKELYKQLADGDFPSKDYFEENDVRGRIGNLFLNPILDRANTLDDVISILNDLAGLIDGLPKDLQKLPNIKCDKSSNMVKGLEDWLIDLTKQYIINIINIIIYI